jgi:hypothetical protein
MERVPRVRQLGRLRLAHLPFHRTQHARVHESEALEVQGAGVMRGALHHGLDGRARPVPGVQFRPVREGKWLQRMAACRHCRVSTARSTRNKAPTRLHGRQPRRLLDETVQQRKAHPALFKRLVLRALEFRANRRHVRWVQA